MRKTNMFFKKDINDLFNRKSFLFCIVLLLNISTYAQVLLPKRNSNTTTNNLPITTFALGSFIEVNNTASPESAFSVSQLVNDVLISGGGNCITNSVTNVVVSPNLAATNQNRSWGYFNKANSNFPFNSGIVLSTGFAHKAGNNYISNILSDNLTTGGDADLAAVLNIPSNFLKNSTYIEFDFVPITNQITFNYLLASEEYSDGYECNFTDAFALLLREVGTTTYTNLAILPNNGGVVSTSNIHPAVNGVNGTCGAVNQQYFGGYNTNNSDTNFQGRTIPLTATATVIPGKTYHFKMVIADYSDYEYDTAVFLDAGSFDIGVKITDLSGTILPSNITMCDNTPQVLKANVQAPNATYKWFFNNNLITTATTDTYTATQPGDYSVEVTLSSTTCVSSSSITIDNGTKPTLEITDLSGIAFPNSLVVCDAVNQTLKATTTATNPAYQWYFNNAIITGATNSTYTATQAGDYSVKISDTGFDCIATDNISISLVTLPVVSPITLTECSPTTTTTFNLVALQSQITTVTGTTFTYYESLADAQAKNTNFINNPSAFNSTAKTIYVLVQFGPCEKIVTVNLNVTLSPTITTQPTNKLVCIGGNTTFNVNVINAIGYQWQVNTGSGFVDLVNNTTYSGVTTNILTVTNASRSLDGYSYKLIVKSNCLPNLDSNIVVLTVPEVKGVLTAINVSCFAQANGSITAVASGGTSPYTYLWSNGGTSASITNLTPGTYSVQITDANGCVVNESAVITQPTVISNTLKVKNVSCNGGNDATIEVIPSGGTAPYTYLWAHNNATTASLSGLAVGTYSVTVKDANNCEKIEQIIITQPNTLNATIVSKNVNCYGTYTGEATVNVTGGTTPYKYSWSNGVTTAINGSLRPGTFTVTVTDANGCIVNASVVITEPSALTVSTKQTKAGCNGATTDSVIATASGGTLPYTYLWSNGLTTAKVDNLLPGTYNLKVTDANGCVVNESVSVVSTANLSLSFNLKNVSCNGLSNGSATAIVTGGKAPFSYSWSTGSTSTAVNNLGVGTYNLTVTDDYGCTVTETFTVAQPDILTATHQQTNISCFGLSEGSIDLTVSGGTAPYTYQWSNGFKTASLNQIPAGTYTVVVTDNNNCTLAHTVTITQPADVATPITTNQVFCVNDNATVSNLVVAGVNVKWYKLPIGGVPLNNSDLLTSGDYFASQTINGCESFARTGINVVVNNTSIPSGYGVQEFCEPFVPKISDLQITGTNVKWYTAAVGGSLLTSTSTLVDGATYYASQTLNNCESATRFAVKVNIYPNPQLVTSHLVICDIATIQDISIEGYTSSQLKWYSSLTATTPLSLSQVLTNGTYYISTYTNNLCESVRKAVQIVVSNNVSIPVTSTQQAFCNSATVADLVATGINGATIKWYNSAQSTTPLALNTQLYNGTYYVEQEMGPCKSARIAVAVRVVSTTAPTMTDFKLCDGATVADLYLAGSTTNKYVWYLNGTTTTALPDSYVLTSGYYYVAIESYGCISNRTSVQVQVNSRPSSPTGNLVQSFNYQSKVANLVMNQPNIVWYLSYNDAVNKMNALNASDLLVDGTTYYGVIVDANSCNSYPTAVTVRVNLAINDLDLAHLKYYPNPVETELTISYLDKIELVEVYSMLGQKIVEHKFDTEIVKIDFSSFSSGNYIVKIVSGNQSQFVKIVKK